MTNNFETGDINLKGEISNNDEIENIDYSIDLTYADENDIAGFLIDNKTGKEHEFDTRLSEASAAPLVVVAVMAARYGIKWAIKKYGKKAVNKAVQSNTHRIAKGINKSLLNSTGVNLKKFTSRVSKKGKPATYKDPKSKWIIQRDTAGHGGKWWKLKNPKGQIKAALDKNGKIISKS